MIRSKRIVYLGLLVSISPGLLTNSHKVQAQTQDTIWTFKSTELPLRNPEKVWFSQVPESCPVKSSESIDGIIFTGRFANYTKADTWYPTWASDGHLYSPWTDGTIGTFMEFVWSANGNKSARGHAKIVGNDPMNLRIEDYQIDSSSALPYQGRYPCGSLCYDGVWYYGTYALDQPDQNIRKDFGWYVLGPFVGFRYSKDYGKTWTESQHTPDSPLIPEPFREDLDLKEGKQGPFIKMGAPHFVDFGKNMEHSPDGFAYLIGHGSMSPDEMPRIANNSWNSGDAVFMARVKPSIENMNDVSKYDFFCGHSENGKPIWSKNFSDIKPVFDWNNQCGIVTMTYVKPLDKYLMCITSGNNSMTSRQNYDTYILESDSITGPWNLVSYMKDFGPQAYFVNIPSKFISNDGRTLWLCYSANYMYANKRNDKDFLIQTNPKGSAYSLCLQELKLRIK